MSLWTKAQGQMDTRGSALLPWLVMLVRYPPTSPTWKRGVFLCCFSAFSLFKDDTLCF